MKKQRRFTQKESSFIRRHARGRSYKETAALLNGQYFTAIPVTPDQIQGFLKHYKIKTGRDSRFKKGMESPTKGKKLWYKTKGFEKGHIPSSYKPVGSERVVGRYVLVKVADTQPASKGWKHKHRLIWEEAHGKVPAGHMVIFADGDARNFDPGNLRLISRRENAVINRKRLRSANAGLTDAGITVADIKLAIAARKRGGSKRKNLLGGKNNGQIKTQRRKN